MKFKTDMECWDYRGGMGSGGREYICPACGQRGLDYNVFCEEHLREWERTRDEYRHDEKLAAFCNHTRSQGVCAVCEQRSEPNDYLCRSCRR